MENESKGVCKGEKLNECMGRRNYINEGTKLSELCGGKTK